MKTNEKKFKRTKVFDCYDMPKDVKSAFFDCTDDAGNHCYVSWYIGSIEEEDPEDYEKKVLEQYRKVDKWLIEQGAKNKEKVIVEHSW